MLSCSFYLWPPAWGDVSAGASGVASDPVIPASGLHLSAAAAGPGPQPDGLGSTAPRRAAAANPPVHRPRPA